MGVQGGVGGGWGRTPSGALQRGKREKRRGAGVHVCTLVPVLVRSGWAERAGGGVGRRCVQPLEVGRAEEGRGGGIT